MHYPLLAIYSDWGLFALRLALGAILIFHGWPKIKNLRKTAESFNGMGFKPGFFWGTIVAIAEVAGGIGLILGLFVQPVAFVVALQFIIILLWKLKNRQPFGKLEIDLLILGATLVLLTIGAGSYSLGS